METVIYFPVILIVVLCGFHFAALIHTGHIGALAASRGAQSASRQFDTYGNVSMAVDEVNTVTAELGARRLGPPTVSISDKFIMVSVFVESPQIVPFLPTHLVRSAVSAREVFVKEQDR